MESLSASSEPGAAGVRCQALDEGGIRMNRVKGLLLHTGVMCSCVCIFAKVLDWFNPFMDFTGHVWYVQIALYFAVIILALINWL